jgi:hypothetical protein
LQPVEVGLAGAIDLENQKFRDLVAMQLANTGFQGRDLRGSGLDEQQGFSGGLDLALPAVDGVGGGN